MTELTRILLIDDHPMLIEGIRGSLANTEGVEVVGYALTAQEGLRFLQQNPVELVLSDINLPDLNGIALCKKIKEAFPQVKVLAFTTFNQYDYITEMMQSGASGYVLKNAAKGELLEAIQALKTHKKYFSAEVTETLLLRSAQPPAVLPRLTRREKEVLHLVAQGLTNQEIADTLLISILTVISHRKNLLTKFEVANTAALVNFATKHGLV